MVRLNPAAQQRVLLFAGTAVIGPALVISGLRYPGRWRAKALLTAAGVGVSVVCYRYMTQQQRAIAPL
jgi:hypothetical protein